MQDRVEQAATTSSLTTASACAANASFSSQRSTDSAVQPALARALVTAGTGPVPMMEGSTPAMAEHTTEHRGSRPRRTASALDMTSTAAAPSFIPEELPAVTVPLLSWELLLEKDGLEPPQIFTCYFKKF